MDLETAKVRARNSLTVIGTEMTKEIRTETNTKTTEMTKTKMIKNLI